MSNCQSGVPANVPSDHIYPFDFYNRADDARLRGDIHEGLGYLHREAPDVFWTPENGGHWVVTRHEHMVQIMMDNQHFSTASTEVPRAKTGYKTIPLNLDPPEHTPYRHILMRHLAPKMIAEMERSIRSRAKSLIEAVSSTGHCDFVNDIAIPFPVGVFMEMIGWPLTRMEEFRGLVDEFFTGPTDERRTEIIAFVSSEMNVMLDERIIEPKDDLMSKFINDTIEGRKLSRDEIIAMCFFLFVAGLDSVANALSFMFLRLGQSVDLQKRLVTDGTAIEDFVAEALRATGAVNTLRLVIEDVEVGGVQMLAGDMIVILLPLAGLDERLHQDPQRFDIDRPSHTNLVFSTGVHLCAGHHLAKMELRILAEEWVRHVPSFSFPEGYHCQFRFGNVMAIKELPLLWQTELAGVTN